MFNNFNNLRWNDFNTLNIFLISSQFRFTQRHHIWRPTCAGTQGKNHSRAHGPAAVGDSVVRTSCHVTEDPTQGSNRTLVKCAPKDLRAVITWRNIAKFTEKTRTNYSLLVGDFAQPNLIMIVQELDSFFYTNIILLRTKEGSYTLYLFDTLFIDK